MSRIHIVVAIGLVFGSSVPADDSLAQRIESVINGPDYKQAHWGILVVDAKTGESVYEHNPDKLCTPASTTKLYSTATALCTFGPGYKFETPVYRRGELNGDRLNGDLILVASGDLTFGGRTKPDGTMAFANFDHTYANPTATEHGVTDTNPLAGLEDLARQIKQAGIRRISGDVLVDDRMFPHSRGSGSGPDLLTPIVVNDNVIDLIVTPGANPGDPASIKMRPETAWVQMDAQVQTVADGTTPSIEVTTTGPQRFSVRGRIAKGSKPLVRVWHVDDPAGFARGLLIECLKKEGVAVSASVHAKPTAELPSREPNNLALNFPQTTYEETEGMVRIGHRRFTRVALFKSPPFSEAIKVTLKVSQNLYASTLPLLVAHQHGQNSIAQGLRWQRRLLVDLGVPVETISFAGGAGGMNADCTTARATVKLIQAMRPRKEYESWHAGFPILGVDGTLAEAVTNSSPAKGMIQAKTGTLSWFDAMNNRVLLRSKALAGTLKTASGKELYFAMFMNDVPLPIGVSPTREGRTLGRLCEIIHQHGP